MKQTVRQKFEFCQFFKNYIQPPVSILLYLKLFHVIYGLVLLRKDDFHGIKCPWDDFKGGILDGMRNFHCNPL